MRNEKKYILSNLQYTDISQIVSSLLNADSHTYSDKGYTVYSVYFDTPFLEFYKEKENGIFHRKKYRIRYYNGDISFIKLECKEKFGNMTDKRSTRISPEEYNGLIKGDFSVFKSSDEPLKKEFYALSKEKDITPKCTVKYTREAYIHPLSETRITFDKNISVSISENRFGFIIPDNPVVMEVKYNKFLPMYLDEILRVPQKEISVSKYQISIEYILKNKGWLL